MRGSTIQSMGIKQKTWWSVTLVMLLSLLSMSAVAATVPGLYSVDVPVQSSQPADLEQAYSDGLRRVLVRVSGSTDVLTMEGVPTLLDNAESLLQSYQYLRSDKNGNRLQMVFGAVGVNKALASVGAPVWGANRPLMLAWIAVESNGTRQLLYRNEDTQAQTPWIDAFQAAAEDRGLPVTLPPAKFSGRRELMSDIWGQFTTNVRTASDDLSHDLISLVRVSRSGNEWRAGWVFDGMGLDGPEQSLTAGSPQELAAAVVGRWADTFAERYAVAGSDVGEAPQVDIVLHNIRGLSDYAAANRVFKKLSPVENAGAMATKNNRVTLRVTFSGEIEQLKRYIALDPRLVPLSDAEVSSLPAGESEASRNDSSKSNQPTPAESVSTPANFMSAPATGTSSNPFVAYESLLSEPEEAENAFESLYQVLHYRWQPAPEIRSEAGE